jgi:hypothetical protein
MATIQDGTTTVAEVYSPVSMNWGAIIGGWLVATAIASLMYVAGLAIGFSALDPYNAAATAKGVGMGTVAWVVLTWAVSLLLGGMFASWFVARQDQTVGALHGITVWGLSVVAGGLLVTFGLTQVVQGGAAIIKGGAAVGAAAAGTAAGQMGMQMGSQMGMRGPSGPMGDAVTGLQAQLTQRVAQTTARNAPGSSMVVAAPGAPATATPGQPQQTAGQPSATDVRQATSQLDRQTMAAVAAALINGNTDNAKALLAANTSMSPAEIDQTLQGLSAQVDKYKGEMQSAADTATRYTASAMWIVFLSGLIALIAAAVGGWLGAGHIHRVHHLRRYDTALAPRL